MAGANLEAIQGWDRLDRSLRIFLLEWVVKVSREAVVARKAAKVRNPRDMRPHLIPSADATVDDVILAVSGGLDLERVQLQPSRLWRLA